MFTVKKVKHSIKSGGWFHRDVHTYSVESINDLEGKWITLNIPLETWDISKESSSMTIFVEETDPEAVLNVEKTVVNKYVKSSNFKFDVGLGDTLSKIIKLGLSFGSSNQTEETKTQSVKWSSTHTTDLLGSVTFYFSDPIVKHKYYYPNANVKIYQSYSATTGMVDIILLPKKI